MNIVYDVAYKIHSTMYTAHFGIIPKELKTAKEGVYVGEDSKIVYP